MKISPAIHCPLSMGEGIVTVLVLLSDLISTMALENLIDARNDADEYSVIVTGYKYSGGAANAYLKYCFSGAKCSSKVNLTEPLLHLPPGELIMHELDKILSKSGLKFQVVEISFLLLSVNFTEYGDGFS